MKNVYPYVELLLMQKKDCHMVSELLNEDNGRIMEDGSGAVSEL